MLDKNACLAYLLGAYLSDGTLYRNCREPHPKWEVTDESFASCISVALSGIGSLHFFRRYAPRRRCSKERPCWVVYEHASGVLGRWLDKVTPNKDCLPLVPRELVRPLVAGLMDGDGCVSKITREGHQYYHIGFCGSKGFVLDFRALLKGLGIKQGSLRCRKGDVTHSPLWRWGINIESFLAAGLNFALPRKQERLALWCGQAAGSSQSHWYPQKVAIAKWWMREVYGRDFASPIPVGVHVFGGA